LVNGDIFITKEITMKTNLLHHVGISIYLLTCLSACVTTPAATESASIILKAPNMHHARGGFDIKLNPQVPATAIEAAKLARQTIIKQFNGDLNASSLGEMLAAVTETKGSAGYVAIERVTGSLQGKKGSFVLMHTGTMNRGQADLAVQIVPDSGTDELAGITGQMKIQINNGQHFYTFDYTLP